MAKGEWFEDWFSSKFYLEIYRHRNDEDARNLINLIQRYVHLNTDDKALDICCGAGRHSLELARRGFHVTGFDLSKFLISEAKKSYKNSPEQNLKVKFLIKDMRYFNFKNSFELAVNVFTSFGYFDDDKENFRVIKNASDSIRKKGYFVFDYVNGDNLRKNIVPLSRNKYGNLYITQRRKIDGDFVIKNIKISSGKKNFVYREKLKLYGFNTMEKVFGKYGLKVYKSFGDYFGNKYSKHNSQRMILFAQKK
ncbi:MAG TPA: class I SAM-dependent methyltransferase [Ignavibacteria bacterium]|nr:class I SAM-dependent methyltransferase [Ignavibacteria bacterium]